MHIFYSLGLSDDRVHILLDIYHYNIFTSGDSTLVYKCPLENNNNKDDEDEESVNELIEHGSIETNELNMTLMSHMTHHDSL